MRAFRIVMEARPDILNHNLETVGLMLLQRRFEEKAPRRTRSGKIGGFCHLYIGQEAVGPRACSALRPTTTSSPPTATTATRWPAA
jgi:TPP-dependent pyruvate/acetoin dehydrogenase alpha subunit